MFEQLVETEPQVADSSRRNYFIISGVSLVAILFTALIVSIFAVDLDLSMGDLDMMELLAPVDVVEQQKMPDLQTAPKVKAGGPAKMATRTENVARIDESPSVVPTTVSTVKSGIKERPSLAKFEIGKFNTESDNTLGSGRGDGTGDGTGLGDADGTETATVAALEKDNTPPPPAVEKPAPAKPVIVSKGVVNSMATSLPKPSVPAAAKIADAAGTVSVKVLVDEKGNVISASAVSGNILLRAACEIAAKNARFTPTTLSGQAIKISGVINYNFRDGEAE